MSLSIYQQRIEDFLHNYLSQLHCPEKLNQAIHYAVLNGGKRFRACLVYGACEALQGSLSIADPIAAAVECLHAYSLVHDDLPAMDDSPLRRGKPSCHIQFDEATAILAGDSLQSIAFLLISQANLPAERRLRMITIFAEACGPSGMAGGQMLDLNFTGKSNVTLEQLNQMHSLKTSALIKAAVQLGALCSEHYSEAIEKMLNDYSDAIGLGFQIRDDILDCSASSEVLGKPQGHDQRQHKSTYITLLGIETAKQHCDKLLDKALTTVTKLHGNSELLKALAELAVNREF